MNKEIYLVRHSGPFIEIDNYKDYKNAPWKDYNRNMVLSIEGERNASKLCNVDDFRGIKNVFVSDSIRSIATAKYITEMNNILMKIEPRIEERNLGIETVSELPDDFNIQSFNNKNFHMPLGESLNQVDKRLNDFINEKLDNLNERFVLVIHGVMLLSYLQNICDFNYDGKLFNISFNGKPIIIGNMNNPEVIKVTYNSLKEVINVERIKID